MHNPAQEHTRMVIAPALRPPAPCAASSRQQRRTLAQAQQFGEVAQRGEVSSGFDMVLLCSRRAIGRADTLQQRCVASKCVGGGIAEHRSSRGAKHNVRCSHGRAPSALSRSARSNQRYPTALPRGPASCTAHLGSCSERGQLATGGRINRWPRAQGRG